MTKTMQVFCGVGDGTATFSINSIGDLLAMIPAIHIPREASLFGGKSSAAFREQLVKEYNAAHATDCPACKSPLVRINALDMRCEACGKIVISPDTKREWCVVDEVGVAEFVGRRIGNRFANRTGDHFHLGEVAGRTLYYGTAPSKAFYTSHNRTDIALVLGSNKAEVPENWKGSVAFLSELFYVNESTGEIRVSHNILKTILPQPKKNKRTETKRMIHERRSEWLIFSAHLLSNPLNPNDFFRGEIKPKVVCDWFAKNHPTAPKSNKTYKRDYNEFRHLDPTGKEPDKREAFIILLLRTAANKKITTQQRLGIAKLIPELVLYLQNAEYKNPSRPAEITRGAWQHCKDGSKEYVPVEPIEKFFIELDKRMGESKDNDAA